MSTQIQVRQHHTNESGFTISAINMPCLLVYSAGSGVNIVQVVLS